MRAPRTATDDAIEFSYVPKIGGCPVSIHLSMAIASKATSDRIAESVGTIWRERDSELHLNAKAAMAAARPMANNTVSTVVTSPSLSQCPDDTVLDTLLTSVNVASHVDVDASLTLPHEHLGARQQQSAHRAREPHDQT